MSGFLLVQGNCGISQFMDGNQFGKSSCAPCPSPKVKKNNFAILGVEVPGRQVVRKPEFMDIPRFRTATRKGCIDVQKGVLLFSETSVPKRPKNLI
jgi:hypothetical protein